MSQTTIFETDRLRVRKLKTTDLKFFDELQGNPNVMKFVNPKVGNYKENKKELNRLISLYEKKENKFLILAVELKSKNQLIGTVALVRTDENENEIGYRFIERCWEQGFGKEVVPGLIEYCRVSGLSSLVAYASYKNVASLKIIEHNGFSYIKDYFAKDIKQQERKYRLKL